MNTKLLFLSLICLLSFSCEKDPAVGDPRHAYSRNNYFNVHTDSSISVITYNIQLGFRSGQDPWDPGQTGGSPKQIHAIAEILREKDPDIVLLQEVPINRSNVEIEHFIEALADSMKMNFAYGGHGYNDVDFIPYRQGVWGNAILSKYTVVGYENMEVSRNHRLDRRTVIRAEIKFNEDVTLDVYSLHHGHKDYPEMKKTKEFVDRSVHRVIMGGDFNRYYGHSDYVLLQDLQDVFETVNPTIDRFYSSLHDTIYQRGYIMGSNGVSDHGAFYARLRLLPY